MLVAIWVGLESPDSGAEPKRLPISASVAIRAAPNASHSAGFTARMRQPRLTIAADTRAIAARVVGAILPGGPARCETSRTMN